MPSSAEILAGLAAIANRAIGAAVAWHVVVAIALAALAIGWRPSQGVARAMIAAPLLSVAGFAFAFGNPFNGVMFVAGSVAFVSLARLGDRRPVARGRSWAFAVGVAMIAFGWCYPHFLQGHPAAYLLAAPLGLIPCPSLSLATGFALLAGGLGARAWTVTLGALGLFYGLFGVLRLGVFLDVGLVGGAIVLFATSIRCRQVGGGAGGTTDASRVDGCRRCKRWGGWRGARGRVRTMGRRARGEWCLPPRRWRR
jgi:hypothetical protein